MNDSVCEVVKGIYLGGIENNVAKTLPLIDVWIYYGYDNKKFINLCKKYSGKVVIKWWPFDDGDLRKGQEIWLKTFEFIKENRDKKILISCVEGMSRSAVMGLWLLCEELEDYEKALHVLKSKRKIYIDKDFGEFIEYLKYVYKGR